MKTISTLLTSFFFTTSIFAAGTRGTASLTVKSADKAAIVVVVDGQRYDLGSNSIMISDLDACDHNVTVYGEKPAAAISCFDKTYDVLFNSSVNLKSRSNLVIAIDACGIITMDESKAKTQRLGDNWQGSNYSGSDYASVNGYSKAINNNEFSRVLWAIGKESAETNKIRSAEQIINTNYFTVSQVKQLLQLFNCDDSKVELAELAYDKTVDQSNYYAVNDIFNSTSSKDELARCISTR